MPICQMLTSRTLTFSHSRILQILAFLAIPSPRKSPLKALDVVELFRFWPSQLLCRPKFLLPLQLCTDIHEDVFRSTSQCSLQPQCWHDCNSKVLRFQCSLALALQKVLYYTLQASFKSTDIFLDLLPQYQHLVAQWFHEFHFPQCLEKSPFVGNWPL